MPTRTCAERDEEGGKSVRRSKRERYLEIGREAKRNGGGNKEGKGGGVGVKEGGWKGGKSGGGKGREGAAGDGGRVDLYLYERVCAWACLCMQGSSIFTSLPQVRKTGCCIGDD
jgi:hypothetical protein